jgi:AraC-like DNA-binding protein
MAPILGGSDDHGLERLCGASDWVRGSGPIEGVELLRAWFAGRAYSKHRHDTYGVSVTDVGVQAFDYRGNVETSLPGQVVVLHPDETHDGRAGADGGFGYRIIYVDPARIGAAASVITGRPTALPFVREPVLRNPRLAHTVASAFDSALEELASDELVVRLAEGMLDAAHEASIGSPRAVDQPALERGRDFLSSQRTIVHSTELERITGLDRYELARQFRSVYGTSPYRYSLLRRLDFARARLSDGVPLAELAFAAGFADQAHFTRAFRSAYGVTPGRYSRLRAAPTE